MQDAQAGKVSTNVMAFMRWLRYIAREARRSAAEHRFRQAWWEKGVSIAPSAIIRLAEGARLEMGRGTAIGAYSLLDLMQDPHADAPVVPVLTIGCRTAINEFNNIRASGGKIVIGSDCLLSQFVSVVATNHCIARGSRVRDQAWDTQRDSVEIGDDVWIGTHAVILPGVTIGTGAVIAAGAVVVSDIPEYGVAAGVPAKVVKFRQEVAAT